MGISRFSLLCFCAAVVLLGFGCNDGSQAGQGKGTTPLVGLTVAFPNLTFELPLDLQMPPDGSNRFFVVEQPGRIRVFPNSAATSSAELFADLTDRVDKGGWEEGLLGLAFDPHFSQNGFFYVNYTATNSERTVVSRFSVDQANRNRADVSSELVILSFNQPYANHNGGCLRFGADGMLYIGTGDGGAAGDPHGNGQNLTTLLGKMLRIDVNGATQQQPYRIPPDNPYVGNLNGWRQEIWAFGLRNPWRYSFDEQGRLWAGDVGQGKFEEIDLITKGSNYGWKIMEGAHCFDPPSGCDTTGLTMPVIEYPQPIGASVTGGEVYRGSAVPELAGTYIYADFMTGMLWSAEIDALPSVTVTTLIDSDLQIASFGSDEAGELYLCAFDGRIYRMERRAAVE